MDELAIDLRVWPYDLFGIGKRDFADSKRWLIKDAQQYAHGIYHKLQIARLGRCG